MKNPRWLDFVVGLFVLAGILSFAWLGLNASDTGSRFNKKYTVSVSFDNVGSLKINAPVMISGVRVGKVKSIALDTEIFEAKVLIDIDAQYKIPNDTSAVIYTAGLVGEQYVALDPGGSYDDLQDGDRIRHSQGAFVMERLVNQLLTSFTSGGSAAD